MLSIKYLDEAAATLHIDDNPVTLNLTPSILTDMMFTPRVRYKDSQLEKLDPLMNNTEQDDIQLLSPSDRYDGDEPLSNRISSSVGLFQSFVSTCNLSRNQSIILLWMFAFISILGLISFGYLISR